MQEIKYVPEGDGYIPIEQWGQDHWSTLAYLETCAVDRRGAVDNNRMRCNPRLHRQFMPTAPGAQSGDPDQYPTRLRGGAIQSKHDDWSCLEDMVAARVLEAYYTPSTAAPFGGSRARVVLTDTGQQLAGALRRHRSGGGNYSGFIPAEEAVRV